MGEFELKYTFHNSQAQALESWIGFHCHRDEKYPVSKVVSIYLESLDGRAYAEKINSDFFKTKHRVRWYEFPPNLKVNDDYQVPVFIETKMKIGSQRRKIRESVLLPLNEIKANTLPSAFHQRWQTFFYQSETNIHLQPYLQISYLRKRFSDPLSGARVSLDSNIQVDRSNPLYLPPPVIAGLPLGVFEIKSNTTETPESLKYLTRNLARKTSFSKYEQCVSLLLS
ncbi:MAG: VTC domain-containing protein [Desulfocapsaceae bacterium]